MGRTIDIFTPTGKDQGVMGMAYMHVGRTGNILLSIVKTCSDGKDQVVMAKAYVPLWEGPFILCASIGKDQGVIGKACILIWADN
jgi:hypothetical protein